MDIVYDIETYPNCFTFAFEEVNSGIKSVYELSQFRNDAVELISFLTWCSTHARLVGFNNLGFDYPVIHMIVKYGVTDYKHLYNKAMDIINNQDNDRFKHQVFPSDRVIKQIDLYKIHHFDNAAKRTSLKALEFNMRSDSIEDIPYPVGTNLTEQQVEVLKQYNQHDVSETVKFYHYSKDMISFREELSAKYNKDFLNFNDVKIGTTFFETELENAGVQLYEYGQQGRMPRQTKRSSIQLRDAILNWIKFSNKEFQSILNILLSKTITETKGVFKDLVARVDDIDFVFGLGGIHASVENKVYESNDDMIIVDIDVESYYPSTAIAQRFYPEHLGETFADIYSRLKEQRKQYKKGTPENAMLKLALNGTYGQSNSKFSVFYDPLFTMKITLNGQLLLCMLVDMVLEKLERVKVIQANTDGITIYISKLELEKMRSIVSDWESITGLNMEEQVYKSMFIRDVNNYIAVKENGSVKRIGAYAYEQAKDNPATREITWNKNASSLVVPIVAEQHLVYGKPIADTVKSHSDILDFMILAKIPRSSKLLGENEYGEDIQLQNVTRYIVTKNGYKLFKLMPPTPKMLSEGKTNWRRIGINTGRRVSIMNRLTDYCAPIDYDYYINEVEKLVMGLE